MFGNRFAHYLSYGATDQQTVRQLVGEYTGLLVPGTVAAFQRDGTGGFVLTLSATPAAPEYVIDPRFPLFQQALGGAKRSHLALAELLGAPELVRPTAPSPDDFTDELILTIAEQWAQFNGNYQASAGSKFAKYARRLGQPVQPRDARAPTFVFAPYLVASGAADRWWGVSQRLYDATVTALGDDGRCVRVLAASTVEALDELLEALPEDRAAIWVSGLEELTTPSDALARYAEAIARAVDGGASLFALYGGFYSVLLQNAGLSGSSHGIGFGEYRNWVELPESGPPPARYYLPQIHRYVQPDEAARLYFADPRLAECGCSECNGDPPVGLDYHALMKHSVRCRAAEIAEWSDIGVAAAADRLEDRTNEFVRVLHESGLPEVAVTRTQRQTNHLRSFVNALRRL